MKVLFMCTANSCRSQMAEAWARALFPDGWEASSAGLITYPITDRTRAAMAEVGISMEGQHTKSLDGLALDDFDLIVTLSRQATLFLPVLAHPERHLKCPIPDPMSATGSPEKIHAAFAAGRDRIREIVAGIVVDHA
ncbi:arsenate reductase ArsC [bacterium]|nr:arsenate reductase ArsC [bacterium]MBU1074181.1 arsenate reductase ArsC [bacterium]MBU1676767.1 arsenate reductase ArsC [bacterium]